MVDDPYGGVEHHLDDHHSAGQPYCHGKEKEDLVEGGKLSLPIGEQGGCKADGDVGRNKEESEAQGIGEAGLEGFTSKESLVVFHSYELHAHSSQVDRMEAVENRDHEGTIGEHHCQKQGGKYKCVGFDVPGSVYLHAILSGQILTPFGCKGQG